MKIDPLGQALLSIARNAISAHFSIEATAVAAHPALSMPGATFVTLTQGGQLRGCIGSLEDYRALGVDVAENAVAAAFRDPRFPPLGPTELARTRIEVSRLSAAEPIDFVTEDEAIGHLRPGIDGVILTHGHRRSTFLPQVWETLPEPRQFMAQLKLKAGLPADFWDDEMILSRYGVEKWKET